MALRAINCVMVLALVVLALLKNTVKYRRKLLAVSVVLLESHLLYNQFYSRGFYWRDFRYIFSNAKLNSGEMCNMSCRYCTVNIRAEPLSICCLIEKNYCEKYDYR